MAGSASPTLCAGDDNGACQFSTDQPGKPALLKLTDINGKCIFCDSNGMARAFANTRTKGLLTTAIRFFNEQCREEIYQEALFRVPDQHRDRVIARVCAKSRSKAIVEDDQQTEPAKKHRKE